MMKYFLWIILIFLVVLRVVLTKPDFNQGEKIRITTRVFQEPIRYETSQRLLLSGLKIYLPTFPEIYYGDRVVIEGLVEDDRLKNPVLVKKEESSGPLYQFRKKIIKVYQKSLPEPHSSYLAGVTIGSKASLPQNFW